MFPKNKIRRPTYIHYLIRLFVFWLVIFTLFRLVFLAFHFNTVFKTSFLAAVYSLIAGFRLDLSTVSYLIIPSFFPWIIQQFINRRIMHNINNVYNIALLFFISILGVANIKMYHEWGALLNYGVFDYLANPKVVFAFISNVQLFLLVIFFIIYFVLSVFLYKKLVTNFSFSSEKIVVKAALIILIPVVLPIMVRGELQLAPIK